MRIKANLLPEDKQNLVELDKIIAGHQRFLAYVNKLQGEISGGRGGDPQDFGLPEDDYSYFVKMVEEDYTDGGLNFAQDRPGNTPLSNPVQIALFKNFFDLGESVWNLANKLDEQLKKWNVDISNNADDENPLRFARGFLATLEQLSSELSKAINGMQKIRNDWEEEANKVAEEQLDNKNEDTMVGEGSRSLLYVRSLVEAADRAYQTIRVTTGSKASDELREFVKLFQMAEEKIKTSPGFTNADLAAIRSQIADLTEIARRTFFNDIRSWNGRAEQQQDAMHLFTTMKLHWSKRLTDLQSDVAANKNGLFAGVPNYRFKVGQMVRVNSSRRYGKVLSISRKGGTGTQQYEVRVNGVDSSKIFGVRELSKVD